MLTARGTNHPRWRGSQVVIWCGAGPRREAHRCARVDSRDLATQFAEGPFHGVDFDVHTAVAFVAFHRVVTPWAFKPRNPLTGALDRGDPKEDRGAIWISRVESDLDAAVGLDLTAALQITPQFIESGGGVSLSRGGVSPLGLHDPRAAAIDFDGVVGADVGDSTADSVGGVLEFVENFLFAKHASEYKAADGGEDAAKEREKDWPEPECFCGGGFLGLSGIDFELEFFTGRVGA